MPPVKRRKSKTGDIVFKITLAAAAIGLFIAFGIPWIKNWHKTYLEERAHRAAALYIEHSPQINGSSMGEGLGTVSLPILPKTIELLETAGAPRACNVSYFVNGKRADGWVDVTVTEGPNGWYVSGGTLSIGKLREEPENTITLDPGQPAAE